MPQPTSKRLLTEASAGEHAANPATPLGAALSATYVTYVDSVTGLPLVGKHVIITVDTALDEIADIVVEDI